MTRLTDAQAHSIRLKIIDAEGDIAERQKEIAAWKAMLGDEPVQPLPPAVPDIPATALLEPTPMTTALPTFKAAAGSKGLVPSAWTNPFFPANWPETPLMGAYEWKTANAVFDGDGALLLKLTETPKAVGQVQAGDTSYGKFAVGALTITVS